MNEYLIESNISHAIQEGDRLGFDRDLFRLFSSTFTALKAGVSANGTQVLEFLIGEEQIAYSVVGVVENDPFWHGFVNKELTSARMARLGNSSERRKGENLRDAIGDQLAVPFLIACLYKNPMSGRTINDGKIELVNSLTKRLHKFPLGEVREFVSFEEPFEIAYETVADYNRMDERSVREIIETIDRPLPNLRNYQSRILSEIVDCRSSLVVLPTGAGKTRLALEFLMNHKGRHYFVVPTVSLVDQMEKEIMNFSCQKNVSWRVQASTGNSVYEANYDVFVGTPTAVRSNLSLTNDSCVVFDEVHHVRGQSLYKQVLSNVQEYRGRVFILGQTASIGYSFDPEKIRKEFEDLTEALRTEQVYSMTSTEVEEWDHLNLSKETSSEFTIVQERRQFGLGDFYYYIVNSPQGSLLKWLHSFGSILCESVSERFRLNLKTIGEVLKMNSADWFAEIKKEFNKVWASGDGWNLRAKEVARMTERILEYGSVAAIRKMELALLLREIGLVLESLKISEASGTTHSDLAEWHFCNETVLDKIVWTEAMPSIFLMSQVFETREISENSETLSKLLDVLKEKAHGKKVILFCELRLTVLALSNFLEIQGFENVLTFSRSTSFGLSRKFSDTSNAKALKKAKYLKQCIMISTSALEEGIDISTMEVVIRIDPPTALKSQIQSKGRAREVKGESYGLIQNKVDYKQMAESEKTMLEMVSNYNSSGKSFFSDNSGKDKEKTVSPDLSPAYQNTSTKSMLQTLYATETNEGEVLAKLNTQKQLLGLRFDFKPVNGGFEGKLLDRRNDVFAKAFGVSKHAAKLNLAKSLGI